MTSSIKTVRSELQQHANKARAEASMWYFKFEPGTVDIFIGVSVPEQRKIAHKYFKSLSIDEVEQLLQSSVHEERLTALFMWVEQYKKGDEHNKLQIYNKYLQNISWTNNWDLVDTSARDIVGAFTYKNDASVLEQLAQSNNIWERRIAIIATSYSIQFGEYSWTLKIAEQLLGDTHHYIHKATGWMLREIGKRDVAVLRGFLDEHASVMPRTMLRYALEKLDQPTRRAYMVRR
jgi:3-methyladenine DNA glycosylase AlkD